MGDERKDSATQPPCIVVRPFPQVGDAERLALLWPLHTRVEANHDRPPCDVGRHRHIVAG